MKTLKPVFWSGLALLLLTVPATSVADDGPELEAVRDDRINNPKNFGLGLQIGETSGLTGKVFLSQRDGIQFFVGGRPGFGRLPGAYTSVDWTHDFVQWQPNKYVWFSFHAGLGAGVSLGAQGCYRDYFRREICTDSFVSDIGLRAPIAFNTKLTRVPVEFYGEVVPSLIVAPVPVGFNVTGGLGARYYF